MITLARTVPQAPLLEHVYQQGNDHFDLFSGLLWDNLVRDPNPGALAVKVSLQTYPSESGQTHPHPGQRGLLLPEGGSSLNRISKEVFLGLVGASKGR